MSNQNQTMENLLNEALQKSKRELQVWKFLSVILLIVAAVFSYVTYTNIARMTKPHSLALVVNQYLEKAVSSSNNDIYEVIKQRTPSLIQDASQSLISYIPTLRKQLEAMIINQIRSSEKEQKALLENRIKEIFAQNKDLIISAINNINSDNSQFKKLADNTIDKVGFFVGEGNEKALRVFKNIDKLLKKIKENKNLTPAEKQIRDFIQLFYIVQKRGSF